jgi:Fur family peroxide stress response transcriptional regulator
MGELDQVTFGSGPIHFDPNTAEHHHAVCRLCGEISDVYVDDTEHLDEALSVEGLTGFSTEGASIVFSGTCADCTGRDHT